MSCILNAVPGTKMAGSTTSGFPIPRPPVLADMRARTDSRCPARPPALLDLTVVAVITSARPVQGPLCRFFGKLRKGHRMRGHLCRVRYYTGRAPRTH